MFSAHPTTDPGIIFWPKPTKKHTSELTLKIDNLKPRKNKKLVKNRLPTGSPNPLKINENPTLDPKLSPLVSQWTPRSTTWWPKVQNSSLRILKWSLKNQKYCPTNQPATNQPASQPASQPANKTAANQQINQQANHQLRSNQPATRGGRRQGRSLKIYKYMYLLWFVKASDNQYYI